MTLRLRLSLPGGAVGSTFTDPMLIWLTDFDTIHLFVGVVRRFHSLGSLCFFDTIKLISSSFCAHIIINQALAAISINLIYLMIHFGANLQRSYYEVIPNNLLTCSSCLLNLWGECSSIEFQFLKGKNVETFITSINFPSTVSDTSVPALYRNGRFSKLFRQVSWQYEIHKNIF